MLIIERRLIQLSAAPDGTTGHLRRLRVLNIESLDVFSAAGVDIAMVNKQLHEDAITFIPLSASDTMGQ